MSDSFEELIKRAIAAALPELAEALRPVIREELRALQDAGDPAQLVDVAEVARLLHRTPAATRRAHERGLLGITAVRSGRLIRFRRADVVALARGSR